MSRLSKEAEERLRCIVGDKPKIEPLRRQFQDIQLSKEPRSKLQNEYEEQLLRSKENINNQNVRLSSTITNTSKGNVAKLLTHGIMLALTQDSLQPKREVKISDYEQVVQHHPFLELPSGESIQYQISDWRPVVFRNIRQHLNISSDDFIASMTQRVLNGGTEGSGKSGALFFKSYDNKYVVKELRRAERDTLLSILESLVQYTSTHIDTFLPRFVGLYTLRKVHGIESMTVVVMMNLLHSSRVPSHVFDLKGSVHNRYTPSPQTRATRTQSSHERPASLDPRLPRVNSSPPMKFNTPRMVRRGSTGSPATPNATLKDLNLSSTFVIGIARKVPLIEQLKMDTEWLEQHNLMDYSFLVGVFNQDKKQDIPPVIPFPNLDSCEDEEDMKCELGAILHRNQMIRKECVSLLPDGSRVAVAVIGHGEVKRSRQSSTIFRQ